ncbi:MAG TPA: alpha/beta hydrolase [Candidatus Limnocylindrales bacterium]|nr:alpha/beta hydrolase [Candidatus Limnocylindrales bacterium]
MSPNTDSTVTLRDGHRLAYTEWGTPDGQPVVYFNGTPGTRVWCPDEAATVGAEVRLIIPDRPGVGASEPVPFTLADVPRMAADLADALDISRFAVIGVSAGGSCAAACAALIPSRLTGVAIANSSLAKWNWEARPEVVAAWPEGDRAEFELVHRDRSAGVRLATANLAAYASELAERPEALHDDLAQAEGDRWFFDDPGRVAVFDAYIRDTFSQGVDAAVWEFIRVYFPWGFRLTDISIPVRIWHGGQDPWVRQEDIDYLVGAIPGASLVVWEDSGHLGFVKHWGEILGALTGGA